MVWKVRLGFALNMKIVMFKHSFRLFFFFKEGNYKLTIYERKTINLNHIAMCRFCVHLCREPNGSSVETRLKSTAEHL